jgi:hypothetical protein
LEADEVKGNAACVWMRAKGLKSCAKYHVYSRGETLLSSADLEDFKC